MAEHKTVKSWPTGARMARACLGVGSRLPITWTRAWGRTLGAVFGRVPSEQRAVSELNLKLCFPGLPANERRQLARRSLAEMGAGIFEDAVRRTGQVMEDC